MSELVDAAAAAPAPAPAAAKKAKKAVTDVPRFGRVRSNLKVYSNSKDYYSHPESDLICEIAPSFNFYILDGCSRLAKRRKIQFV